MDWTLPCKVRDISRQFLPSSSLAGTQVCCSPPPPAIPGGDPKETPPLQFLHTMAVVNQHIHLIDKEFNTKIVKAIQ